MKGNKSFFFLLTLFSTCSCSLYAASTIYGEQKINVYNIPHNQVDDLNPQKLQEYTKDQPLYSVKQGVSSGKTMIKTKNDEVVIVLDKTRNPILNYNDILHIAKRYASENIPLVDKQRIEKTLNMAKLETDIVDEKKFTKDDNSELIVAIKENKNKAKATSNLIDYSDFTLIESLNYFIENYNNINKAQTDDIAKDTRFSLVSNIKTKLKPYKYIDSSLVDYSINLAELKLLRRTVMSQSD